MALTAKPVVQIVATRRRTCHMVLDSWLIIVIVTVSAFMTEVVDGAIGMGYGTILVPVLLMVGFDPFQVVPAVLVSQLVGGLLASVFHHRFENVDFGLRGKHLRLALALGLVGAVGAVASVFVAVNLSGFYLSLYIGLLAMVLGGVVLVTRKREFDFSWRRIATVGFMAAFNKGLSGGGYGPVVTVGQIMSGVGEKSAVCVTLLSEVVVSLCAVFAFVWVGDDVDWVLACCLTVGVSLSAPVAAFVVKRTGGGWLKILVGVVTVLVGLVIVSRGVF